MVTGEAGANNDTDADLRLNKVVADEISAIILGVWSVLGWRERGMVVGVQERVIRSEVLKKPPDGVGDAQG